MCNDAVTVTVFRCSDPRALYGRGCAFSMLREWALAVEDLNLACKHQLGFKEAEQALATARAGLKEAELKANQAMDEFLNDSDKVAADLDKGTVSSGSRTSSSRKRNKRKKKQNQQVKTWNTLVQDNQDGEVSQNAEVVDAEAAIHREDGKAGKCAPKAQQRPDAADESDRIRARDGLDNSSVCVSRESSDTGRCSQSSYR